MKDGWFKRLVEAINADGRSHRKISMAAGCGPNYVNQMIVDEKEPGTERFVRLLNTLGGASSLYVILGIEMKPEDEVLFQLVAGLPDEQQRAAIEFFRSLRQGPSQKPSPPAARK